MKTTQTISTKQIRDNLVPFLKSLNDGRRVTVVHRSKPLVVLKADEPERNKFGLIPGSPEAVKKSLELATEIRKNAKVVFDPNKSIKQLYRESMAKKYDIH